MKPKTIAVIAIVALAAPLFADTAEQMADNINVDSDLLQEQAVVEEPSAAANDLRAFNGCSPLTPKHPND